MSQEDWNIFQNLCGLRLVGFCGNGKTMLKRHTLTVSRKKCRG